MLEFPDGNITYEVIAGEAIYQNDIVLGNAEEIARAYEETTGKRPVDPTTQSTGPLGSRSQELIVAESNPCPALDFFTLGKVFGKRWGAEVPYVVSSSGYTDSERAQVEATMARAVRHYAENTGVNLVRRTDEGDYIEIRDFGSGENPGGRACGSSPLGRKGGKQSLRFIPGGSLGCLLHELGHALGVAHEQARADRNDFVEVRMENVADGREHNFDQEMECAFDDVGPYDMGSIMHYGPADFMRLGLTCNDTDRSGCTIVPRDESISVFALGRAGTLSEGDRRGLCDTYSNPTFVRFFDPTDGSELSSGSVKRFADGQLPRLEVSYTWRGVNQPTPVTITSDVDGEVDTRFLSAGVSLPVVSLLDLSAGGHVLTFDFPEHCPTSVTREVEVVPYLDITSPPHGSTYSHGGPVPFSANVVGLGTAGSLTWESSIDGVIDSSSPTFFSTRLSEGTHELSATAAFPDGTELVDRVTIEVTNRAPTVELSSPADGSTFCVGEAVDLRAHVSDIDLDTIPDSNVVWTFGTSTLGTGRSLTHTFASAATNTLQVTATDGSGGAGTDQITMTIDPCTTQPPVLTTSWPAGDATPLLDEDAHFETDGYDAAKQMFYKDLTLSVTANDPEDGPLTGSSVVWTTDRTSIQPASLGTGTTVSIRLYSPDCFGALHTITVKATDSDGMSRSATWLVRISGVLC